MKKVTIDKSIFTDALDAAMDADIEGGHVWDEDLVNIDDERHAIAEEMIFELD